MADHQILTPNRDVQQTTFSHGVVVTVNFGTTPFLCHDGQVAKPTHSGVTQR